MSGADVQVMAEAAEKSAAETTAGGRRERAVSNRLRKSVEDIKGLRA